MSWIKDRLPPMGDKVECLMHYVPSPYYVKIGIRKASDEKYYTGLFYRKRDKNMSLGYIWTDGVGSPSAKVVAWRPLENSNKTELSINCPVFARKNKNNNGSV